MELVTEGKNFRLVQEDQLPDVLDYLAEHLPESLKFHQTIKTYLHDRVWEFHFYVSKSWPEEPIILHFPGITSLPGGRLYDSFSVFCPVSRLECLHLLAEEDQLLDWSRPLFLNFTHARIVETIEELCGHRLGCVDKVRGDIYVCERGLARGRREQRRQRRRRKLGADDGDGGADQRLKDECGENGVDEATPPAPNAEAPDDGADGAKDESGGGGGGQEGGGETTEEEELDATKEDADGLLDEAQLRQLEPEHAAAIHSLYPANDMESVEVFERLIRALPAFGVFSSDGELAAWMVQSYYGAMFSMQTLPAFRRRGYGLLLARRLTSAVLARGYIPFVVIRPENSASQSLYAKLGFRRRYETVRAILRPKGWPRGPEDGAVVGDEAVVPEVTGVAKEEEELLAEAEVPEQGRSLKHKAPKVPSGEAEVPEVGGAD
ncbi:uncharacterized protein LOC124155472 [Ischnura elegans]|uniref:uncharacterized protein LOC124155472 n=1 Tax=Ischnura elegans TaxID=197161 RepID=UPI001ED88651|nr:uncharacterized protein LOC124155472 [Ischnura elegans]